MRKSFEKVKGTGKNSLEKVEGEQYFYEHLDDLHMIAAQNAIDDMPTIIPASKEGET